MTKAEKKIQDWVVTSTPNLYTFAVTKTPKGFVASIVVSVYLPEDDGTDLDFIGDENFDAQIYSDGPDADINPSHIAYQELMDINSSDIIYANLAPGGGQVMRLFPSSTSITYHTISGNVNYYDNNASIEQVQLNLTGAGQDTANSNSNGYYEFSELEANRDYYITASKPADSDFSDFTISSYDAALTAQAAVGLRELSEFQEIAADVNKDGRILTFDAALIAQYAVGFPKSPDSHVG